MSVKIEEKVEEPVTNIKQQCVKCLKGPNLIKTIVIIVCTAVVVQQITVCIRKLIDAPITTYTHFDFNKTIMYPSITFCREPPYKFDKMLEYGLYAHPRFTSVWTRFNFSAVTLDKLWEDITYTEEEFFAQYGLNGLMTNVEVHATVGFMNGRCYTLTPKVLSMQASRTTGYSVTLQHSAEDAATSTSVHPPGYHVFVHYTREPYTEVEVYNGGLVDYLYLNTGETMDVKLTVDEYIMINEHEDPCIENNREKYSANICTSQCVWSKVGEEAGCSGPWMIDSPLPRCDNYTGMRDLISAYINTYEQHECASCPRFCHSYLYNAFVTDRQIMYTWDMTLLTWSVKTGTAALQSQIYLHFNSMMVSVYEERYNYDWNLFISDLGGSVGFLLGLSVIGLMAIVGKIWSILIKPFIHPKSKNDTDSITSNSTTDLKTKKQGKGSNAAKDKDFFTKCNIWNVKNNNK